MGDSLKQMLIGLAAIAVFGVPGAIAALIAYWLGSDQAAWFFLAPYLAAFALFAMYAVGGAISYEIRWKWGKDV